MSASHDIGVTFRGGDALYGDRSIYLYGSHRSVHLFVWYLQIGPSICMTQFPNCWVPSLIIANVRVA